MEILLVLQIIVVIALIAIILVQKTSSDGFTGGSSSPNSFLTGRASANLFTRATSILATIFILNSLALAYIASHIDRGGSILEQAVSEMDSKDKQGTTDGKSISENLQDKTREKPEENKLAVPLSETVNSSVEKVAEPKTGSETMPANNPTPAVNSVPTSE